MSEEQQKKRRQMRLSRLEIVAEMYKRGNSVRRIQAEVMNRLGLDTYSLSVVDRDIKMLLAEWREHRLDDVDMALQLELERIDDTVRELWMQWDKSKQDYTKTSSQRKGAPVKDKKKDISVIKTCEKAETKTNVVRLGDVSYISEIRQQLMERRKLLGLYLSERGKSKQSIDISLEGQRADLKFEIIDNGESDSDFTQK